VPLALRTLLAPENPEVDSRLPRAARRRRRSPGRLLLRAQCDALGVMGSERSVPAHAVARDSVFRLGKCGQEYGQDCHRSRSQVPHSQGIRSQSERSNPRHPDSFSACSNRRSTACTPSHLQAFRRTVPMPEEGLEPPTRDYDSGCPYRLSPVNTGDLVVWQGVWTGLPRFLRGTRASSRLPQVGASRAPIREPVAARSVRGTLAGGG
jgi:hypothetical protein